jgi:hypothetical protein
MEAHRDDVGRPMFFWSVKLERSQAYGWSMSFQAAQESMEHLLQQPAAAKGTRITESGSFGKPTHSAVRSWWRSRFAGGLRGHQREASIPSGPGS